MSEGSHKTPQQKKPKRKHSTPSPNSVTVQNSKLHKTMSTSDFDKLQQLIQSTIQTEFAKFTSKLTDQLDAATKEISDLRNTISHLESQNRKKNLVIYGIPETASEKWKDIDGKILDLSNKLGLKIDYDHAFRLGKPSRANRPILLKLLRMKDKIEIIGSRRKLKGTGIYLNDDLNPEDRKTNSLLLQKMKELKTANPHARVAIKKSKIHYDDSIRKVIYGIRDDGELHEELGPGSETFPMESQ